MKKISIKVLTALLTLALLVTSLPLSVFADTLTKEKTQSGETVAVEQPDTIKHGYIELSDGYIKVRVSVRNGGFYVGTEQGNVLAKDDDHADLTYTDHEFDTSFTSFRITRNGVSRDYIFGRDYTNVGVATSAVNIYKSADNAVVAEWMVDGVQITQTIALMGEDSYQHGMAYISYEAVNVSEQPLDNVEARVMMDTALGTSDYAYYMLAQNDGSYTAIETETTVAGSDYSNYFFAYDSKTSPTVTAYTLNSSVNGEMVVPRKVTFAHWANLASSVFDYTPTKLNFTKPLDSVDHLTADSAVALYYSIGGAEAQADVGSVSLYYGVYSNYNAGDAEVALNFTTSGTMFFNEAGDAYKDQNGELPGNFSTTLKIQNTTDSSIEKLAVAIYPEEELYPHNGGGFVTDFSATDPYYQTITDLKAGESRDVRFDFKVEPTLVTGYRRIKIVVYNITAQDTFEDGNTILEEETYVLCPGAEGAEVSFTGMTPSSIFMKGKRFAYITGTNFGLIRDKSQYRIILRPMGGGDDVVLDQDKVVINQEKNTATLVLDMDLAPTTYEVIIDWNDASVEDMTSEALRLMVTDIPSPGEPGYVSSGVYGIITIERDGTSYDIVNYESEEAFKNTATAANDIMMVFRGDFNVLASEEKGNFKAEAVTLMAGDIINISDTLDIKNGRVTITKNFDDAGNQTEITVDIDGKVYTTKANTKVWDGILAVTAFTEGTLFTLPVYNEQGVLRYADGEQDGEMITLLWPGAASASQTILGMILNFRYGQFALMEQGEEQARVIAFGAALDSSFLFPGGSLGTDIYYSNLEKKQLEMGVSAYTAEQLRMNDTQFRKDQANWRASQAGTLNMYVDDILFGAGGFIGFNTQVEVGIPAYVEGMPYIQGVLALKVINDYWEFGVEGKADVMVFEMEASLKFKSYEGIPIPDEISFFVGGTNPGLPVDPFGVFWVRGMGAGIYDIYETFFGRQTLPPLTLVLSGEFAVFAVLSARANVSVSAQAFGLELENVGVAGVTIIDRIGGTVRWYPNMGISFGVRVDILDCIIGEGSIVAREEENGDFYFCAYVKATIKIPDKIWFVGGTTIASVGVGLDTNAVWGSVKIIGIAVGVKYYWGGGVDVSVGKEYDVPTHSPMRMRRMALYSDPVTRETLYMEISSEVALLGEGGSLEDTVISSSASGQQHSFTLSSAVGQDGLLVLTYNAANELMASDYRDMISIQVDGEKYPLEWYNSEYSADHVANVGTNAIYQFDAAAGIATVTVSFTDNSCFDRVIEVEGEAGMEAALYGIDRLVDFNHIEMNRAQTQVTLTGRELNTLSELGIYAEDESGALYQLASADVATLGESSATIPVQIPQNMQTGKYTVKAIGTLCDASGEKIASPMIECDMEYVNANQPAAPIMAELGLSGNYTVTLKTDGNALYDGYLTNIYEVTADGYEATIFADMVTELAEGDDMAASILMGGRYSSVDENEITTYTGLEAGKKYVASVQGFVLTEDGSRLLSSPVVSNEIMMVMPIINNPTFSIDGANRVEVGSTGSMVDTVNKNSFTIRIGGVSELISGSYKLNSGESVKWDAEAGEVVVSEQTFDWNGEGISVTDLADGTYYLTVSGVSATYDEFTAQYMFTVDTEAPGILVSSPQGGGFFNGKTVTVSGIAEADATIEIMIEGDRAATLYADENGAFTGEVEVDETMAYQDMKIYAIDGAGNRSMPFGCTLTNSLLGNEDLQAVILYGGREVNELVVGADVKQLTMAFKTENTYITFNKGSVAESLISWSAQTINGRDVAVTADGQISGDSGAEGIVTATLEGKTAMVMLVPVDLATAHIMIEAAEKGLIYNGTEQKPTVQILEENGGLVEGIDYTVSYVDNVNAGVATAIITATDNGKCKGTRLISFEIIPADINTAEMVLSEGESQETPAVSITYNGMTLTEGKDYTLEYVDDGKRGIVTVTGIGNYRGMRSQNFEIVRFDHAIWIIPTATLLVLGGAALTLALVRRMKKKRKKDDAEEEPTEAPAGAPAEEPAEESVEEREEQ